MELPKHLIEIARLSDSSAEEVKAYFTRREYHKGEMLFTQGDVCRQIFYVEQGLVRLYYHSGTGKDITAWFAPENNFIAAVDSLFYDRPTRECCEALEDSVIYTMEYADMEGMLSREAGARLSFFSLFEITRRMSEYIVSIKFQTAEERYRILLSEYPSVFQRVQLGHVASFLGITQETLSRIRAGK